MTAFFAVALAIVLHEAGHALAAFLLGVRIDSVRVFPFPAIVTENPRSRAAIAAVALAAPALNFGLCFAFLCARMPILAAAQLIVGVLAILPYPRSDSWHVLEQLWK